MTTTWDTAALADALDALEAGERAWFHLCTDVENGPPLVIASFREEGGMKTLVERTEGLRFAVDSVRAHGMAHVGEDGAIEFASRDARVKDLRRLALWTKQNVEQHPGLARLRYASMLRISEAARVAERFEDPVLWWELPERTVPGSLQDTSERLVELTEDVGAWFWLSDTGPGDAPFLSLSPIAGDPEGRAFANRITDLRRRSPEGTTGHHGVVRRSGDHTAFAVHGPPKGVKASLTSLAAIDLPGFDTLADATVVGMRKGKLVLPKEVSS